ncbi:MAG TPA: ABC transporter permease [Gemmatimonadaceae bacterium]|nr:ABC transporter permease [Gemmatimonadaceae bacterium]
MRVESLWQDLRYAVRGLRAKPGFAVAVVVTLALGIGANAAMFGIVDRLLFRPPSFLKAPDRVHRVYLARTFDGKENYGAWFQYTRYKDLERWSTDFDAMAAFTVNDAAIGVGDDAREMSVAGVSASYWSFFDARPVLGRFFTMAEDTTPTGAAVAVLSYALWQTRFGGSRDVLGKRLKVANADYTIIGVAPQGFAGVNTDRIPVIFVPITTYAANQFTWNPKDVSNWYEKYNISWMQMIARRKADVSIAAATADLTSAYKRSYQHQIDIAPRTTLMEIAKPRAIIASVLAERGPNPSADSKVARWVSGVAAMVLLIAAANVANLLLARALRRRREVAVRLALGVTRARLLSQLLTESILLALLGGLAGLLIAQWGGKILRSQFLKNDVPVAVMQDSRTLLFAAGAVLFVGLLTGLAPAFQSGRGDLTTSLKSGSREGTYHRSRLRVVLLVFQGALSVVLLVGAGLFVRSMNNVRSLRLGYDVDRLLIVNVDERGEKLSDDEKNALRDRIHQAASALPGVESAARAVTVPFYWMWDEELFVQGFDTVRGQYLLQAASPEYFRTAGTRIIRGRGIEATDTKNAPLVTVVSEAMARTLWPTRDALGQCMRVGADTNPCTTVVGIAENIRAQDLKDDKMYFYYLPIDQKARTQGGVYVRVTNPALQKESIRRQLQKQMPGASYVTVTPMSEIFDPNVRSWRLGATMFVAFGALALLLAAIGLYSVIAYNVVQRTHELGVRVAFGAQMRDVVRLILGEGLRLAVAGVVIGGAIALFAGRWVAPLLYDVRPTDPLVYGSVIAVLLAAAGIASLVPALRAARVDPNVALRSD